MLSFSNFAKELLKNITIKTKQMKAKNTAAKVYKEYSAFFKKDFDLEKFNKYAVIHHSNYIEGSTLTLGETVMLLDEKLTPKNKPLEHTFMCLDHEKALKYVIDLAQKRKPITSTDIKNISAILQKNTGKIINTALGVIDTAKGDYRKVRVRAGESTFKAEGISEKVDLLMKEINKKIKTENSYIKANKLAFDAHFTLVSIHPFSDGNGRTSRLLMNYIQEYHKFPLTYIHEEDKQDYYKSLVESRKKENPKIFRNFMFEQAEKMMKREIKKAEKQTKSKKRGGITYLF